MATEQLPDEEEVQEKEPEAPRWTELGLPLPRLQLTWEKLDEPDEDGYTWLCRYEIMMPLPKHDIRNERQWGCYPASIGGTRTTGAGPMKWGKLETPFRDGSHIQWDSINLGMPAFVVYGDNYRRLDRPERQWPPLPEEQK